jgi:hypothetical protein
MALHAGFARRDLTPPIGTPALYGVTAFVREIWDPLYVTALVLREGEEQAVVVGADICAFLRRPYQEICAAISLALGLPADHVVLNASHSHCAPYLSTELQDLLDPYGLKALDPTYARYAQEQIVEAVRDAAAAVGPVYLSAGRGTVERVASNRRPKLPNGHTIHRYGRPPEEWRALPEGLIDPEVQVVRFDDPHGSPIGAVINYACHPTAAGGGLQPWISADFVGYGLRSVETALGDAPCLFLQGTAGNIGTGKWVAATPRQDTEAMGQRFAAGILRALPALQPVVPGPLQVLCRQVLLSFDPFPPLPELERRLEAAVTAVEAGPADDQLAGAVVAPADALIVARRAQEFQQASVLGITLGDLAIACLPAEVFVEFGLAIKERSPFRHTMVAAYNDNSLQYIPTAAAFPEGEFEVDGGWRYIASGAGEALLECTVRVLTELGEEP